MSAKTVTLRLYDWDRFSANDALGEVVIPLWQVDLAAVTQEWRELQPVVKTKVRN